MPVPYSRRRAVHHQVRVGDLRVDGGDTVDGQDVAGGLARELVGAVAGADGDGERVDAGAGHEVARLHGVGQQHVVGELACGADAVFLARLARLQRAQAAQFALDRDADGVCHLAHASRHVDVVVVAGGGLGVFAQRAVHHHAGEARADGLQAHGRAGAVVLVQHDGQARVRLSRGQHHVAQVGLARVLARAGRGLQDHRAVGGLGRLHDGLDLLQVVDVEGGHAVAVAGGMVQHGAQVDEGHGGSPDEFLDEKWLQRPLDGRQQL